ncbi:MAG: hypothetical protein ACFFDI_22490 [Promethearchaeota archaeon]
MISDERKPCIERFIRTHQDELVYVPEMTHDQVVEKFNKLLPTILQSEIIFQVIHLPGLN